MREPAGRETARSDVLLFAGCVGLALLALAMPHSWAIGFTAALRNTALRPLVSLQNRAAQDRVSRFQIGSLERARDSLALLVQATEPLRRENESLRALLQVRARTATRSVGAEVLHRPSATDARMLLLSVGSRDSVHRFDPVVSAEGLIGQVEFVSPRAASVLTWANPDFRASAVTADGRVRGMLQPSTSGAASRTMLELHGVAMRDSLGPGTAVYTAGDGGAYPRGIPVGKVISFRRDSLDYERIYLVMPLTSPGDVSHVMVLLSPHDSLFAPLPGKAGPP